MGPALDLFEPLADHEVDLVLQLKNAVAATVQVSVLSSAVGAALWLWGRAESARSIQQQQAHTRTPTVESAIPSLFRRPLSSGGNCRQHVHTTRREGSIVGTGLQHLSGKTVQQQRRARARGGALLLLLPHAAPDAHASLPHLTCLHAPHHKNRRIPSCSSSVTTGATCASCARAAGASQRPRRCCARRSSGAHCDAGWRGASNRRCCMRCAALCVVSMIARLCFPR